MAGDTMKDMTTNFEKLDKFEGYDFRRWQKKVHFFLTTLKVIYVLTTLMPELLEDATMEAIKIRAKWENDDYICRGHMLNDMSDSFFNIYTNVESAKELWDSLESKYMVEDSSKESLKAQDRDKGKGKEVGGPSVNITKDGKNKHNKQNKDCHSGKKNNANAGGSRKGLRTNPKTKVDEIEWWIDSSATTHVCKDRCWFKTFEPVKEGSVLYMGNEHFAPVHGKGNVALKFSSGKTITLFNVLYEPKLRKNLVSGPVLNKCGCKQVYESDKTDQNQVDKTKKFLSLRFSMKDMGEVNVILDCSSVSTPMDPVKKLKPNTGKPVDQLEYSRAIGCLMYDMINTRPDITYTVGRLSAISWAYKKQTCITGLTMESEFVALAAAGKEAEGLRNFIHEIPIWLKPIAPISI
nr:zinc finger, CCHC-type [Tanacetum cinerariifolium]